MTKEEMFEQIKNMATQHNVELTENAQKVANARAMMNCFLDKCICNQKDEERFCISKKCMDEIKETGQCHCRCYRRKE